MPDLGRCRNSSRRTSSPPGATAARVVLGVLLAAAALTAPRLTGVRAGADTLQMSADSSVTGWYANEPQLNPSNVTNGDFGEIFDTQLDGQVYAQPLVSQPTVLAVTENDYAYGLNSTTGAVEWRDSFGTPADPLANIGCGDVGSDLGITGTPVIDPSTHIAYFVAAEEVDGAAADFMEAVNVQTGTTPAGWPTGGVPITGSSDGDPNTVFNGNYQTQRAGLVLVNGVVYAAFGSQCDYDNWEGWLVGVSTTSHTITTMWSTEEDVTDALDGGGIWQSGSAPVVDSDGDIFVATGNGDIPAGPEPGSDTADTMYGEAVVELDANATTGHLQVVDWFMADDASTLNNQDGDLGSGGPVALPTSMGTVNDPDPMVVDGKQGILYVLNMDDLGGYQQGASGGDDVESESSTSEGSVWGKAGVWPGDDGYIYYATSGSGPLSTNGGALEAFQRVDTGGTLTFSLAGSTSNSGNVFGFGSGSPIITSDGTTSGSALLWVIHTDEPNGGDAQLEAFDPVPVGSPGPSAPLEQVWSSPTFTATVFSEPSVDNGVLYVGTRDGTLLGFGALASSTPALSGSNLTFPTTVVSQSSDLTETFTATVPTTVNSLTVSGAAYSLGAGAPSLPVTLSAGQSLNVPVTFTPDAYGSNEGTLTANITGDTAIVGLSGEGDEASASISISPDDVTFPTQLIAGPSVYAPVTITNVSTSAITVNGIDYPASPFTLSDVPSTPLTLEPSGDAHDSLTFDAEFTPPGSSGDFDHVFNSVATLSLTIGGNAVNFGIALSGSAAPPAQITTIPNELNFGDVAVGSSSTMSFDLGDQGGFPLTIISSTPPTTDGFSALTNPLNVEIAPNSSIQETVQFAPTADGAASSNWLIEGNDGNGGQTVTLTGTGYTPPPAPPPPVTTTTIVTTTTLPTTTTTAPALALAVVTRSGPAGSPITLRTKGDSNGGATSFRVRDGTASGCSIEGAVLRAKSVGTCIVIATKSAKGDTPAVSSPATTITFKGEHPKERTVTLVVKFDPASSSLSAETISAVTTFAKKLAKGESVTVTGYALRDTALAQRRAASVAHYLSGLVALRISERSVSTSSLNEAVVTS